jgi:hypothetical protein
MLDERGFAASQVSQDEDESRSLLDAPDEEVQDLLMGLRKKEKVGVRIDIEGLFGKPVKPSIHVSPDDPAGSEKIREIIECVKKNRKAQVARRKG